MDAMTRTASMALMHLFSHGRYDPDSVHGPDAPLQPWTLSGSHQCCCTRLTTKSRPRCYCLLSNN
eukprot:356160-Chlamydomonas_euryale.AAC.1